MYANARARKKDAVFMFKNVKNLLEDQKVTLIKSQKYLLYRLIEERRNLLKPKKR